MINNRMYVITPELMKTKYYSKTVSACCFIFLVGLFSSNYANAYNNTRLLATKHIHAGSTLILHHELTAPGGEKVFIQNGKAKNFSDVYQRKPYCYFRVIRAKSQIDDWFSLQQDQFTVKAIYSRKKYASSSIFPGRWQLASNGIFDAGQSAQLILTEIQLESANQPTVASLNCGIWAVPSERRHLSISEVQKVFGDLISLKQ